MEPKTQTQTDSVTTVPATVMPDPSQMVPTAPPSPVAPTSPDRSDRDIYDSQGRKWRDRVNGWEGYMKQVQKEHMDKIAELQTQIDTLSVGVAERDTTIVNLTSQVDSLAGPAEQVPQLTEQIQELTKKAAKADKYRMLMAHPQLLQMQVEQPVEPAGEGEEPTTRTVNPLLELVESSDMSGEALQATLSQLVAAMPSVGPLPQAIQQGSPPPTQPPPMAPAPGEPLNTNDIESWYAKAREAHQLLNTGDMSAQQAFNEAWDNINRLNAAST